MIGAAQEVQASGRAKPRALLRFKGDFPRSTPGRFTLAPHCFVGGGEGGRKLASYLTPCSNRLAPAARTRNSRQAETVLLQPTRLWSTTPDLAPRTGGTLRQLCLHIVRERERKPPATKFRRRASTKGSSANHPSGTCRSGEEQPLDLLKIRPPLLAES